MKKKTVTWILITIVAFVSVGTIFSEGQKEAPEYTRPINVVVGYGAGGFTDLVNRKLAEGMSKELGVPISVVNMPGGSGGIAAEHVYQAPHDGQLILGVADSLRIQAVMGFHPTTVFETWQPFIAVEADGVISVGKNSPYKSFQDIIDVLSSKPESLTLAASSTGTTWHIQSKILERDSGLRFNFVPYPGSHPAQVAAVAGEVDVVLTGLGEQIDLIRAGELVPLAAFKDKPFDIEGYGEIPALTQFIPGVNIAVSSWMGMAVPKDIPPKRMIIIEEAFLKTVNSEAFKDFVINDLVATPLDMNASKSLEFVKEQTSVVSWLLWELGMATKSPEEFNIPKP